MISVLVIVSFLLSVCLTRMFMSPSSWFRVMDHPNERSLHTTPIPRGGGVAILVAFLLVIGMTSFFQGIVVSPLLLFCMLLIAVISFLDDCYSLSAALRFFIHFCAAVLLVANGFELMVLELPAVIWQWPNFIALLVSSLFVVWSINLYNFMDGMDGFAAGMAILGFSCFAILGWQADHQAFMTANLILVGAVFGFLWFNFPPAKIFMGDAGSSTLGFCMAAFSLWASVEHIFPIWVAILVFSPFIIDASVTLCCRLYRRERIWEAHKKHYYQRLVLLGWGHKKTVVYAYILMVLCGVSSGFAMHVSVTSQLGIVLGWGVIYLFIIFSINRLEHGRSCTE